MSFFVGFALQKAHPAGPAKCLQTRPKEDGNVFNIQKEGRA